MAVKSPFVSGPWRGFYLHPAMDDERHVMELVLHFADGAVSGSGDDDVGPFVIRGRYDDSSGEVHWTKTYLGRHDVFYRGYGQTGFIWGTWELPGGTTGGFKIWPKAAGEAATVEAVVEEELPDAVGALRFIP